MAATSSQIRRWFVQGQDNGYKRMVVFCDSFDSSESCCYPHYSNEVGDDLRDAVKKVGDRLMEVYDLTADLETQMRQARVYNYDSSEPEYVGRHRATEAVNDSFN